MKRVLYIFLELQKKLVSHNIKFVYFDNKCDFSLRLTARRALIEASPSSARSQDVEHTGNVGNQPPGVENLAYENEPENKDKPKVKKTGKAVLHFPHPPASSPTSR